MANEQQRLSPFQEVHRKIKEAHDRARNDRERDEALRKERLEKETKSFDHA
jgi:hypothetical protein